MRNSINEVVLVARNTVSFSETEHKHDLGVEDVLLDKNEIENNDIGDTNILDTQKRDTIIQYNDSDSGASIYGTTQKVPDQAIIDNVVKIYLNAIHA